MRGCGPEAPQETVLRVTNEGVWSRKVCMCYYWISDVRITVSTLIIPTSIPAPNLVCDDLTQFLNLLLMLILPCKN